MVMKYEIVQAFIDYCFDRLEDRCEIFEMDRVMLDLLLKLYGE